MHTLHVIYLTLGRIRGLDVSFEIHVATHAVLTQPFALKYQGVIVLLLLGNTDQ